MTRTPARASKPWGLLGTGTAAVAACAVCCAGPRLAALGGVGVLSAIGALWVPGLAVLAAVAVTALVVVRRRRRAAACSTGPAKADLGMPSLGPPGGSDTTVRRGWSR
ncbi:hypothetical protein AB0K51_14645 [Kitasatospora sp. NPDC049285]|uniref:hypothetical protein n=1 Tax=Kitasatospora sp. NPDC049285 TaxID=3157096 RepID=UPI00343A90EF